MVIKVKKVREDAIVPKRIGSVEQSAWIDLNVVAVSVNGKLTKPLLLHKGTEKKRLVEYRMGDTVTLHTGVAMELPFHEEGWLLPRSSTFKKTGLILSNGMGIIDNAYCGNGDEWMAMCYATRDGYIEIGERYLQFRTMKNMLDYPINEEESLNNKNRSGYGSTDKEVK